MKIKDIIRSLNQNSKRTYLVLFALIFVFQLSKVLVFNQGVLYNVKADGLAYVGLNENLYNNGAYEYRGNYTQRMPSFTPIYLSLRYFLSQHNTLQFISIFMLVLYSFSVVYFSKTVRTFFNKGIGFSILLIFLLGFTDYITYWGFPFYTESFAGSSILLGFSFFLKAEVEKKNYYYFLSGLFMCWLVFLRPFMIVIWLLLAIYIIVKHRKELKIKILIPFVLFVSMFLVLDSIWIARNYMVDKKLVPLQSELERPDHLISYRKFLKTFGGDAVEWNPNSEGMWFQSSNFIEKHGFERPSDEIFSQKIFNESFTLDSLKELRRNYWNAKEDSLSKEVQEYNSELFVKKVNDFIEDYKKRETFDYYIGSRITLLRKFVIHPFTYYLSLSDNSFIQLGFKTLIYVINAFVLIIGFIGLIWFTIVMLFRKKFILSDNLFLLVPLFLIALFPLYYGFVEYRFIVLAFPFLAYYGALLVTELVKKRI